MREVQLALVKVLVLVIDAGDPALLSRWADEGLLPSMQAILGRGLVAETRTVEGLYEGATWPSLYTGVAPGHHGFHRLTQIEPGTYDMVPRLPGEFIREEPFWSRLSREGFKVAVLDVPLSGVSEGLNGIQIVEWGSHDAAYGLRTWPPGLKDEVLGRFGEHPAPAPCDAIDRSPVGFLSFKERLLAGVDKKCDLTLHYLSQTDWDLFIQVFTEAHCAGHQAWHLHDPDHPNYDPAVVAVAGDPVREVYQAIDEAIGRILAQVDEHTIVLLLGTHGMAHNFGVDFLLEELLVRSGYLTRKPVSVYSQGSGRPSRYVRSIAALGWRRLPSQWRRRLRPHPAAGGARSLVTRYDLTRSKCFPHPNGHLVSGIRFNLKGREPQGTVAPGPEMDELCAELAGLLLDLTETRDGLPLVKRVLRTSELFRGDRLDHLPDLLVEWDDRVRVGSRVLKADLSCRLTAGSSVLGEVEGEYRYCRTGDHRPEGLLVAVAPGLSSGKLERVVSLLDIAPTILALFGVTSEGLEGRPISEVVEGAH